MSERSSSGAAGVPARGSAAAGALVKVATALADIVGRTDFALDLPEGQAEIGRREDAQIISGGGALLNLEVTLPQPDGPERQQLVSIAITASILPGDRERCLAAGMDDCLGKPIAPAELRRALSAWAPAGATAGPTAGLTAGVKAEVTT